MTQTMLLLHELKAAGQDHEWYPTTQEMVDTVSRKLAGLFDCGFSLLDIGAGDGRVITMIDQAHKQRTKDNRGGVGDKYAIEKAPLLIQAMPEDICIVGTDFLQQTLIDKKVDVVFCNPPYSEYEDWTNRILRESNCAHVFMIIPSRWKDSAELKASIERRGASMKILASADFLHAERAARAKVDIVYFDMRSKEGNRYSRHVELESDPFDVWFSDYFKINLDDDDKDKADYEKAKEQKQDIKTRANNQIVKGKSQLEALVELYRADLDKLLANYKAVGTLDADILRELGVSVEGLKKGLKEKIEGLKHVYWQELFGRLDALTARLTTETRKTMLNRLNSHMHVDFTEANISAVVIWALKNVNKYIDSQLLQVYKKMTSTENATVYKSNGHIQKDGWRYESRDTEKSHHYRLEYRLVLSNYSAIDGDGSSGYSWDFINNLHKSAHDYISDIFTIANNLGFKPLGSSMNRHWESNQAQRFSCSVNGQNETLCEIRAFKNGNIHIKASKAFMMALNVEAGRLNGWIKSPKEAATQMDMKEATAERFFMTNLKFDTTKRLLA